MSDQPQLKGKWQDPQTGELFDVTVTLYASGVGVLVSGYGTRSVTAEQESECVYIEHWGGFQVHAWADINEDDPVTIDMSKAKLELYQEPVQ